MIKDLKDFISKHIPQKHTNILYQLFSNTKKAIEYIDLKLNILKRERNILTATSTIALRHLASQNGIEPVLKTPARGILELKINSKVFNQYGYPLFITPYTIFRNKENKISYYYEGERTLKVTNEPLLIPVTEGIVQTTTYTAKGQPIEEVYLKSDAIVEKSVTIKGNNGEFVQVGSFYNSINEFDNRQFVVKFSANTEYPLILYIKGAKADETLDIAYKVCNGEYGNITGYAEFEIDSMINTAGEEIPIADSDVKISNFKGFDFGSNGTTTNALRSAIGYNHGHYILFDNKSYINFLNKFSNILIQNVEVTHNRSINNLYISRIINLSGVGKQFLKDRYKGVISDRIFWFDTTNMKNLGEILSENEYALSSHNLKNALVEKWAVQIEFLNNYDLLNYGELLERLIYEEFSKFFYDRHHKINFELFISEFSKQHENITLTYKLFRESVQGLSQTYIISHQDTLPILKGNFKIIDKDNLPLYLFEDINLISLK